MLATGLLDKFDEPQFPLERDLSIEAVEETIAQASDRQSAGIGFTEIMAGYIHTGENIEDFEIATRAAKGRCESARFFLSVKTWDIENRESQPINRFRTPQLIAF